MDRSDDPQVVSVDSSVPQFRPGNITRITMIDFLTFSSATFFPGPRMNLVIGPNGSGKSTIVACVCLVFAGSARLLGRSPDLGAFVRHGSSNASIEAHVYEPRATRGYVSVRREFDTDGKGSFYINAQKVKKEDVINRIVKKYDIQLDNLSQFMPQEKIAEFTNIKPDELLTITVRSLGGAEKETLLQKLIERDNNLAGDATDIEKSQEQLKKLEQRQEECEVEVSAIKEQRKMQEEIQLHRTLLHLIIEFELHEDLIERKELITGIEEEIKLLRTELAEASAGPLNAIEQRLDAAKEEAQAAKEEIARLDSTRKTLTDKMEDNTLHIKSIEGDMVEIERSADSLKAAVRNAEEKLAAAQHQLEEVRDTDIEGIDRQLQDLDARKRELSTSRMNVTMRKESILDEKNSASTAIHHANGALQRLQDPRDQRYRALARNFDVKRLQAVEVIINDLKREGKFRGDVYGPVAVHIEVNDQYHARVIQSVLSGFIMTAFVTEHVQDNRTLLDVCRERLRNWVPDVVTVPTTRNDEIDLERIKSQVAPRQVDARLKALGIVATIPDIYNAPRAVRAALNAQLSLHLIYVGTDRASANQDALRNEDGVQTWYTPRNRVNTITSRYDPSVRNLRLDTQFEHVNGELFSGSVEEANRRREEQKQIIRRHEQVLQDVGARLESITQEEGELGREMAAVAREMQQLRAQRTRVKEKEQKVRACATHLDVVRDSAKRKNVAEERAKLEEAKHDSQEKGIQFFEKLALTFKSMVTSVATYDEAATVRLGAERDRAAENLKHEEKREQVKTKQDELNEKKAEYATIKKEWKQKKIENTRIPEELVTEQKPLIQKLLDVGSNEVERKIEDMEGKVGDLISGGQSVLDEYNQRERKIADLTANLQKLRSNQDRRETEFREKKQRFLEWLKEGVGKMRKKFSGLYARLGCSGDLALVNAESGRLGDLALEVLVSYRNDVAMRPISNAANSGGEKMCCTMIFSFALQLLDEERVPPFVIVDELNQGLDLHNELKIMSMMIEDAGKANAPQSFVITPKLLSDLPLHACTKTHIIFNGPVRGKQDYLDAAHT